MSDACQHGDNTELDCGHLSSCSDSEESSSEETLDIVLNAGNGASEREMNDVDDETMSGDNDVYNSNPGNNPSSLQMLSDFDSLTDPESLMMAASGKGPSTTAAHHTVGHI